jgi:hypothetical protein
VSLFASPLSLVAASDVEDKVARAEPPRAGNPRTHVYCSTTDTVCCTEYVQYHRRLATSSLLLVRIRERVRTRSGVTDF